ncbi:MAG TPA: Reeler domain-containing protein [Candidatus Krumholzibacteria bacterium]|nr:Reeler domain-containing protein [Candidatus Krumholzibacteria bacterium]
MPSPLPRRFVFAWASIVWAAAAPVWGYSSGAGTCSYPSAGWYQMGGGQAGTGGFVIRVFDDTGPVTHYSPGATYTVEISNTAAYPGFLLQCVRGVPGTPNLGGAGVFTWTDSALYHNGPCSTPTSSVTHAFARAYPPEVRRTSDTFLWTAPAIGTGSVTFHLVGVRSQYEWYGQETLLLYTLMEGGVPVRAPSWSAIKNLFR